MHCLGVIPAAGEGSRWGGYYKELLPCGDGEWLIDRTIEAMRRGGADAVLVVASHEKLPVLAGHLRRPALPLYFAIQRGDNDIWSAIEESFGFPATRFLFAMPDTYYPVDAFEAAGRGPFALGLHDTRRPERFGVLVGGQVANKQAMEPGVYRAWGLLAWSSTAVQHWQRTKPADYTDAINGAIAEFGLQHWPLDYYYDMASFADYQEWLCR